LRARRVDENQKAIINALRKIGATVADTSRAGHGFPDLVVGRHGMNYLIEIKDGDKQPARRKLTPAQQIFHETWRGQIITVTSVDEAINAVTSLAERARLAEKHETR
jgi:predicted transcriptional regulator